MDYTNRLKKLKMPTLRYRGLWGDMIEVFKIINGIYYNVVTVFLIKWCKANEGTQQDIKKTKL